MRRNLYSRKFFAYLRDSSDASARALVPLLVDIHPARSMIDVGCGIGGWVRAFGERGVSAVGIDGDYVDCAQLLIPPDRFVAHDLNQPIDVTELGRRYGDTQSSRFDLAISLEVAEHLRPERSESLVRDLAGLADVVLFAAAIPFQGGAGHINERWESWWAQKFSDNGYDPFDVLRRDIWGRRDIAWWYKQNAIFYVKRNSAAHARFCARFGQPVGTMFDLVHPELFRGKAPRLKHGNVVQKVLNRFRRSADVPRAQVFETPLYRDEGWHRDAKPKS